MQSNRFKLAALTCTLAIAAPVFAGGSADPIAEQSSADRDRNARINEKMGLVRSSIVRLDVAPGAPVPDVLVLPIEGVPMVVTLESYSVRHAQYRVLAQTEDGAFVEVEPSPVNTLRGKVLGLDNAVVAGSMEEHGLHLRVLLPEGDEYWVEPLKRRFQDAAIDEYVMYRISDVLDCAGDCGTSALADAALHRPFLGGPPQDDGGIAGGSIKIAELACDADYEYYLNWGSVSNVENRINAIVNSINVLYENQVNLTHQITTIIVRTSSNQPYTQTHPQNLLNQFRSHWNANHGSIQRDVAHLFTGKDLNGSTIGIAWLGVVCNLSYAYGLSQSDFSSNFACVTDLTAHEIGHNWNAPHCSCPNHTMNASITCANNFHSSSINSIVQFSNAVSCLSDGGDPPPSGIGACCTSTSCFDNRGQSDCDQVGGIYLGDDTTCDQCADPGCPAGEVEDCNGNCAPASWVGDGICDDGSYVHNGNAIHFDCEEFNCDAGDCNCGGDQDPPTNPVSMSVASISLSTVNVGQGWKKGQAIVSIVNDLGQPVQGATVTGTFSGDYNETQSAVTNSNGQATLLTDGVDRGNISFSFCVTNVAGSLQYVPGDNAVTCAP